eukprot:Pgem_evm1s12066
MMQKDKNEKIQQLRILIKTVHGFPKKNIIFRDIISLTSFPLGLKLSIDLLFEQINDSKLDFDAVVTSEAGGIVFASPIAYKLQKPIVLARKAGKIPPEVISVTFEGSNISGNKKTLEISRNSLPKGANVIIVDDVIASGATVQALLEFLTKLEVKCLGLFVVAEFPDHGGRHRLRGLPGNCVYSLLTFSGL